MVVEILTAIDSSIHGFDSVVWFIVIVLMLKAAITGMDQYYVDKLMMQGIKSTLRRNLH